MDVRSALFFAPQNYSFFKHQISSKTESQFNPILRFAEGSILLQRLESEAAIFLVRVLTTMTRPVRQSVKPTVDNEDGTNLRPCFFSELHGRSLSLSGYLSVL